MSKSSKPAHLRGNNSEDFGIEGFQCRVHRFVAITLYQQRPRVWGYSIRLGRSRRLRPYGWPNRHAALEAAKARINRHWERAE